MRELELNLSQNPPQVGRQTNRLSVRLSGEPSHYFLEEWSWDMMGKEDHFRGKGNLGIENP